MTPIDNTVENDGDDTTEVVVTEMRDVTREGIRDALATYYRGDSPSYTDAFSKTPGIARDTYYRYKREQPELISEIDDEARELALRDRGSVQTASDAQLLSQSYVAQHRAIKALIASMSVLESIAKREPYEVQIGTKPDGSAKMRTMLPYARDAVSAFAILQDIARHGALPDATTRMMTTIVRQKSAADTVIVIEEPAPVEPEPVMPILGVNTAFTRITTVAADGTEYTATVKRGDVVEGEVEEITDEEEDV